MPASETFPWWGKAPSFSKIIHFVKTCLSLLRAHFDKEGGCSFSIHICHINDDNFSQGSAARSFAPGTSPQELTPPYPSFLLQAPGVYRNNIIRVSENTALPLYRFYSFKTMSALLFLGTCSWDKGSSCLGTCHNKQQRQTVLFLVSFFLALNSSWIFPFYPTSFPICFPPCLNIILLVTYYLHQYFPFCEWLSPHILLQNLCPAHYQAPFPPPPFSWSSP